MPDLHQSAWTAATENARATCKTTAFNTALAMITVIVGGLGVIVPSTADLADRIAIPIVAGVAAIALTYAATLAVHLVVSPLKQRNELRRTWPPPDAARPISPALRLRDFARLADDRRVRLGRYMNVDAEDEASYDQWASDTMMFVAEHAPTSAKEYASLPPSSELETQYEARADFLRKIAESLEGHTGSD